MVYLIDDKKSRQEHDYSWTSARFSSYNKFIKCIYTLDELENSKQEIFSSNNIVLYHDSFFDNTCKTGASIDKKNIINKWSKEKGNLIVVFSGSKNTREINENIANIPVSILYANLEVFLKKIQINDVNLNYLLFGHNIDVEQKLSDLLEESLKATFDEVAGSPLGKNLFIYPSRKFISSPFTQFERRQLFSDISDNKITEKISEWLNIEKYDNIFIPLCYGNILSDFNGLRLAAHIRCTHTINQISRIFIYGFVGIEHLIENEYFNVLKSKNIYLVPFSKNALTQATFREEEKLTFDQLPTEIKKLKLDVPSNYFDSHSIGNIWGMHRLLELENIDIKTVVSLDNERNNINNLYFKYLQTINKSIKLVDNTIIESRQEYKVKLQGPKVVGKINIPNKFKR